MIFRSWARRAHRRKPTGRQANTSQGSVTSALVICLPAGAAYDEGSSRCTLKRVRWWCNVMRHRSRRSWPRANHGNSRNVTRGFGSAHSGVAGAGSVATPCMGLPTKTRRDDGRTACNTSGRDGRVCLGARAMPIQGQFGLRAGARRYSRSCRQ